MLSSFREQVRRCINRAITTIMASQILPSFVATTNVQSTIDPGTAAPTGSSRPLLADPVPVAIPGSLC